MSVVLGIWSALQSKALQYSLIALAVLTIIWRLSSALITTGVQQEKLRTVETTLKEQAREEKAKASIDAMSDRSIRDRMLSDWTDK